MTDVCIGASQHDMAEKTNTESKRLSERATREINTQNTGNVVCRTNAIFLF